MKSKKTEQPDSKTSVNRSEKHGLGLWGNPRTVMGIRADDGLQKQFKIAADALFGSTCLPIESFMASVVGIYQNSEKLAVNRGSTVSIGEIKIERNLRERRKLPSQEPVFNEETDRTVVWEEERESKIIMPKTGLKSGVGLERRREDPVKVVWVGERIDVKEKLESWAMLSLEERLHVAEYAKAFRNSPGAEQVLKWFAIYKFDQKSKLEVSS